MARVEFDRKGHELEQCDERIEDETEIDEAGDVEENADEGQRDAGSGADIADRDDGIAQFDGHIALRVLCRVARLMTGDADGGDGRMSVGTVGQADDIGLRIVVVGEFSGDVLDTDIGDAVVIEHFLSGLFRRQPLGRFILVELGIDRFDAGRRDQGSEEAYQDQDIRPRIGRAESIGTEIAETLITVHNIHLSKTGMVGFAVSI